MKKILLATALIATTFNAFALTKGDNVTLKKESFGCKKLPDLRELLDYSQDDDQQSLIGMVTSGKCWVTAEPMTVTIHKIDSSGGVSLDKDGYRMGWTVKQFLEK